MPSSSAVRVVAVIEALKGGVVLVAATGLLSLVHKDLHELAARLIAHAHLNPAAKYPRIFIDAASHLQDSRLMLLALGAAAYSLARGIEAYGLFHEKAWAEVLAAASGAVYVPIEIIGLQRHASWLGGAVLAVNLAVVAIMVRALHRRRAARRGGAV
jgi:uncharacterized membrane protein (DUF2068 family)